MRHVASRVDIFGGARQQLFEAMSGAELDLVVGRKVLTVATPNAPILDGVEVLVAVNVWADGVQVAGRRVHDVAEVASAICGPICEANRVFVVRAEDAALLGNVFDAIAALRRAGAEHIVLGVTSPSAPLESWSDCPFPAAAVAARIKEGVALVSVDRDDAERPAVVRVLEASGHGFGGAAALCALRRGGPADVGKNGTPFRVRFLP